MTAVVEVVEAVAIRIATPSQLRQPLEFRAQADDQEIRHADYMATLSGVSNPLSLLCRLAYWDNGGVIKKMGLPRAILPLEEVACL